MICFQLIVVSVAGLLSGSKPRFPAGSALPPLLRRFRYSDFDSDSGVPPMARKPAMTASWGAALVVQ